jgi:hypothetical protein
MNNKPKLKVKHKVEDLISFIEKNNLEGVKKIVESDRKIVTKQKMDERPPIYYAVRYKNNKIFKFLLENTGETKIDVH